MRIQVRHPQDDYIRHIPSVEWLVIYTGYTICENCKTYTSCILG